MINPLQDFLKYTLEILQMQYVTTYEDFNADNELKEYASIDIEQEEYNDIINKLNEWIKKTTISDLPIYWGIIAYLNGVVLKCERDIEHSSTRDEVHDFIGRKAMVEELMDFLTETMTNSEKKTIAERAEQTLEENRRNLEGY